MESSILQGSESGSRSSLLFGELLVAKGLISRQELLDALTEQRDNGGRIGEVLTRLRVLKEEDVTKCLAEHLAMDHIRFDDIARIDMSIARQLPESIAKRFCMVAIGESPEGKIVISMADPLNVIAIDTVSLKLKRQLKIVISSAKEIRSAIESIYHGSDVEEQQIRDLVETEVDGEALHDRVQLAEDGEMDMGQASEAGKAPVVRFVDLLLRQAVKSRASDIHIEPQENNMSIRMRIDGELREMLPPSRKMQPAVVTRVKIISHMDIAERRVPQDGRFRVTTDGRDIDVRVNTIPTIYGEKVVMRILDKSAVSHNIDALGFEAAQLAQFKSILTQPHGIVVVTGPTGSGKSTTLYSALTYLKDPSKNITTVEDPVEYRLAGINQIQVKPEIELDFAKCLRAILRQDPDIILIGEIRDKETVEIAIQASLTGHLVLSTFHTNDAPSAISRFKYMGLEPYLLASTLNLVVAQRLVRKICEKCKEPVQLTDELVKRLGLNPEKAGATFYHGKGCNQCGNTGYYGRLPVFEFLALDEDLRLAIVTNESEAKLRAMAREKGNHGILESGVQKMIAGLTTAEEVLSVAFTGDK